jgi:16S rRNA (guanine527-N7)-methyltransferase
VKHHDRRHTELPWTIAERSSTPDPRMRADMTPSQPKAFASDSERPTMTTDDLGAVTRDRLRAFAGLVARWNPTIKLVSSPDLAHLWSRHVEDALQLIPHMPATATHALDLGSGGGFPGLVLAIATGVRFDLIESDSRKAAFLQEAAMATAAPATIHMGRIEDVKLPLRLLVTARALAPLPKLLELAHPFLDRDGVCLFPKGERAASEIAESDKDWIMDLHQISSRTSSAGRILRVSRLSRRRIATP